MRSSRLNILAAELFSVVTEVQTVTGWSQLVFQPGVSRSVKPGDSSIFSWSGRGEGWCGAQPQNPDWPHRANVCLQPKAAQLISIAAPVVPTEEGGAALGLQPLPCQKRTCRNHSRANATGPPYCPLFLLKWSSPKRVLGAWCFPAGSHQWLLLSPAPKSSFCFSFSQLRGL